MSEPDAYEAIDNLLQGAAAARRMSRPNREILFLTAMITGALDLLDDYCPNHLREIRQLQNPLVN